MADPAKFVVLRCDDADTSLAAVKKDGILKAMGNTIPRMINDKSGGKLTTKNKGPDGYSVLAKVVSLKADDAKNPKKLIGTVNLLVAPTGTVTKGANVTTKGEATGVNAKNIQQQAELLVSDLFESLLITWFKAI